MTSQEYVRLLQVIYLQVRSAILADDIDLSVSRRYIRDRLDSIEDMINDAIGEVPE